MSERRIDLLIGLSAIAFGLGTAALEGASAASYVAGVLGRRHPRAGWLITAGVVLVVSPLADLPFGISLVVIGQGFWAGRDADRWWGIAGVVALMLEAA